MQIDTMLLAPPTEVTTRARELADLGFDGVFTFEGVGDVFLPLALAAEATDLTVYSNVAIAFPRSPMHVAYTAWDLQTLSRGRFLLGLGTQVRANIERRYSAAWSRPVERMTEFVEATKAIFRCWQDGEPLDFHGDFHTFTLMQPTFHPGANAYGPPPILVGAVGPRLTRAVAGCADGLLLHPFTSERFLREQTLANVAAGLERAGRRRDELSIVATAIVCTGRDERELAAAEAGTRSLLAFYGSTPAYRPVLEVHGWGDLQTELNALSKQGRWAEMARLVDDQVLDALAVRGEPRDVAARILARYGDVADRVGLSLPYAIAPETISEVRAGLG